MQTVRGGRYQILTEYKHVERFFDCPHTVQSSTIVVTRYRKVDCSDGKSAGGNAQRVNRGRSDPRIDRDWHAYRGTIQDDAVALLDQNRGRRCYGYESRRRCILKHTRGDNTGKKKSNKFNCTFQNTLIHV